MRLDTWIENLEEKLCDYSIMQRHKVLNRVSKTLDKYKTDDLTEEVVMSQLGTVEEVIASSLMEQTKILMDSREISSVIPMKPKQVVETGVRVARQTKFVMFGPVSLTMKALMLVLTYWLPIVAAPAFFGLIYINAITINGGFEYLMLLTLTATIAMLGSVIAIFTAEIFDKISNFAGDKYQNRFLKFVANINVGSKFEKRQKTYTNFAAIGFTCLIAFGALFFISTII